MSDLRLTVRDTKQMQCLVVSIHLQSILDTAQTHKNIMVSQRGLEGADNSKNAIIPGNQTLLHNNRTSMYLKQDNRG